MRGHSTRRKSSSNSSTTSATGRGVSLVPIYSCFAHCLLLLVEVTCQCSGAVIGARRRRPQPSQSQPYAATTTTSHTTAACRPPRPFVLLLCLLVARLIFARETLWPTPPRIVLHILKTSLDWFSTVSTVRLLSSRKIRFISCPYRRLHIVPVYIPTLGPSNSRPTTCPRQRSRRAETAKRE